MGRQRGYSKWTGKASERTAHYVPGVGKSVERLGHVATSTSWRRSRHRGASEATRKARWEQTVEAMRVQPEHGDVEWAAWGRGHGA